MKAVIAENGSLNVIERSIPEINARQVLIKIHATALNRADLLQAKGAYPPPPGESDVLGLECAGVVEKVGPECETSFKPGDRVNALLGGGGYAEYVNVDERQVMSIPEAQPFHEAAAIPEVWLTAYQLLHFVAKLKHSDSVLIHAGGSGVGTAAVQLAKAHGCENIFVTAGSTEKIELAKSLGATDGWNYKTEDWAEEAQKATTKKGVDVILDCIGFPYAESNAKAIGMDGRWVLFGLMGGGAKSMPPLFGQILRKRIQILGSTLRARSVDYKANLVSEFEEVTKPLFADGTLKPVLDKKHFEGLDSMTEAQAYMGSNANMGKIVVSLL
eukprot:CAMPEP_0184526456 /NCGR_PEP_ID=MMETSP0198_2-20121128/10664_1 /TAXON_ID=1112570 /ORGANISM="Thraustochytrium sp., Strain LLF1b" /LENGTH=328 /DNA_ID=CAMNT_0026918029 /DNA_START=247 /DNA_END=1233 /DNA_ORIENTATION=+